MMIHSFGFHMIDGLLHVRDAVYAYTCIRISIAITLQSHVLRKSWFCQNHHAGYHLQPRDLQGCMYLCIVLCMRLL